MRIAAESLTRVKGKVRELTRRSRGKGWAEVRESLRRAVVGWVNYYALADAKNHMEQLDEWLRRRTRQMAWKQWKTPKNRYRQLKARGVTEYWAIRAGGSSKGVWRLSKSPPIHKALSNDYWRQAGLVSFSQQYELRQT